MIRWLPLAVVVLAQIAYPLAPGDIRAPLVVLTVAAGYAASVGHAFSTRGTRVGAALVVITTGGGLAVEAIGVATGVPFGEYRYGDALGPKLLGVPLVIPLAWTWIAWPAWLVAGQLVAGRLVAGRLGAGRLGAGSARAARIVVAGTGLAAWDLFLDPQMEAEGYWRWTAPEPVTLPGVPEIPVWNYVGWLFVSVLMMAALADTVGPRGAGVDRREDAPMLALFLWTYFSSIVAHAVFLGLPASAAWGALGMGLIAVPLTIGLLRR